MYSIKKTSHKYNTLKKKKKLESISQFGHLFWMFVNSLTPDIWITRLYLNSTLQFKT